MASQRNLNLIPLQYSRSDSRRDRLLIACGPAAMFLIFVFFWLSDLIPPVSPLQSPQDTANHYQQNSTGVKIGTFLLLIASCLWPLSGVGIAHQLLRIPGISLTMLILELTSTCILGFGLAAVSTLFSAAVYRVDRDPTITQLASDLAWILYMSIGSPLILQQFAISWAILSDDQEKPLFSPRVAWIISLGALWIIPTEYVCHAVHSGPFAWDGFLTYWVPWGVFGLSYGTLWASMWNVAGITTEKTA